MSHREHDPSQEARDIENPTRLAARLQNNHPFSNNWLDYTNHIKHSITSPSRVAIFESLTLSHVEDQSTIGTLHAEDLI